MKDIENSGIDYHALQIYTKVKASDFLLIESKSLPRSGLHYLKSALERIFREDFSFCEKYQEPGCCNRSPCALTGFIPLPTGKAYSSKNHIRLVKSHDFDLMDPDYDTPPCILRIVLIRDPLYVLTSLFALDTLTANRQSLLRNGIHMKKIWYSHEYQVLDMAWQVLDPLFAPISQAELDVWLHKKEEYIKGFVEKWSVSHQDDRRTNNAPWIIEYDDIPYFLKSIITIVSRKKNLRDKILWNIRYLKEKSRFKKRNDPFSSPSEKLTAFLRENRAKFEISAERIKSFKKNGI